MKKIVLSAFILCAAIFTAKAEYLYWQVGDTFNGTSYNDGTYWVGLYQGNTTSSTLLQSYTGTLGMTDVYKANLGTGTSVETTYFIEVYSYDSTQGKATGTGNAAATATYADLAAQGAITGEWAQSTIAGSMPVWTGTNVVPEPTTGLLTLVGMALLGLKRRRI